MSLPKLTIVPAGAGSGKTYKLQKQLYEWIEKGLVSPDRIVAVTFTEAAAAELRNRIRTELVDNGRLQDALKLDQSYISTIHGFGLRIMTEFAFDAGVSPLPRMLNDDEESSLIRLNLSSTTKADEVASNLKHFGYLFDHKNKKGPEDLFRDKVLGLVNTLRSIGRVDEDPRLLDSATQRIEQVYGRTESAVMLKHVLLDAVGRLLAIFPQCLNDLMPNLNDTAKRAFRQNSASLKRAASTDALDTDWSLWQQLRDLRCSKRGTPTPDGYDVLAEQVMDAANALPLHPGPLHDAILHIEALLGASQEILTDYAEQKHLKGLVDFTDMLAIARSILTTNTGVLKELHSKVDCLVIDEFQDTNPIQFSLLWALFEAGVPTLIVGDLKQAIMRFQNADSRLMESLQEKYKDYVDPLTSNWRSSKELMRAVNLFGAGLFDTKYEQLTPMADFTSKIGPIDCLLLDKGCGRKDEQKARHMALHISHLLESGSYHVWDKKLKKHRLLQGADIALLCYNHDHLDHYANALHALGLNTRLTKEGWFESRSVQLLYYALLYTADPADKHAALYLAVTELGSLSLQEAVSAIVRNQSLNDPVLDSLDKISEKTSSLEINNTVGLVIRHLDLFTKVSRWRDADQARANLIRFQGEVEEFFSANGEALISGGYYSRDLKTFLAWLKAKVAVKKENSQPNARAIDENAIDLVTWHASKGREWPVVAVCRLDKKWDPRLPGVEVVYEDFHDLGKILDSARIDILSKFSAPESNENCLQRLSRGAEEDALNLLYVTLTRAREKLILECPVNQKSDIPSYWNLIKERAQINYSKTNQLEILGEQFACSTRIANFPLDDDFSKIEEIQDTKLPTIGRRAIKISPLPTGLVPETKTPSSLHGLSSDSALTWKKTQYTSPLSIEITGSPMERGTLLHRCFELVALEVENNFDVDLNHEQQKVILSHAKSFYSFLTKELKPTTLLPEVPILFADNQGSVVAGNIDLLVESDGGYWIIDHKSDVTEELDTRAQEYMAQLLCYKEAVAKTQMKKPVLGVMINWISPGIVSSCVFD